MISDTNNNPEERAILVVPTYNEAQSIGRLVSCVFELFPAIKILVVDDNSPDGTADVVKKLQDSNPNLHLMVRKIKDGLGNAYKAGFEKVFTDFPQSEVVMMIDADFYHDPTCIKTFLDKIKSVDLVIGSSQAGLVGIYKYRILLSRWANFYCRTIFGYPLRDWTNAFLAIRVPILKKVVQVMPPFIRQFSITYAVRYIALRKGATYEEFEIPFTGLRQEGVSKMKLSTILEGVVAPWKLRFSPFKK